MLNFASFLHLQNRHGQHTKIDDTNYKYQTHHNHNNKTHKNIKKLLHKTSEEQPTPVSYLKFDNVEHHATADSPADAAPAAAAAWCCSQSGAGEFRRCSGDDRCAAGTPCAATRCCHCCSAQCASARLWRAPSLPGCCCATAARRFPFCRLSTGICPIRQQLQWAHGAALRRVPAPDCADCRLAVYQQENSDSCPPCCTAASATGCIKATCNNNCYECCSPEALPAVLTNQLPTTTTSKLSSIKPWSLAPFQMKLKLLTGTATNCC
uniref:Uncharacterized protein n=1 Tax=Bactrocera latifrons TaxID=174628 RepID=A0A0K8UQW5_BACLA